MLYALEPVKSASGWHIDSFDLVDADDIQSDDSRIFVARESNIDWVAEALVAHLNREPALAAA